MNYDKMPQQATNTIDNFKAGNYLCVIETAEVKVGKPKTDANGTPIPGKPYLTMRYGIYNAEGKRLQGMFDRLFESEHALPQAKVKQFIDALNLPVTGNFEFADLVTILPKRQLYAELIVKKDETYGDQIEVNGFAKPYIFTAANAPVDVAPPTDADAPEATETFQPEVDEDY